MNTMRIRTIETESLGTLLLGIWLIATAVLLLAKLSFPDQGVILAVLAIAAGALLLVREVGRNTSPNASQRIGNVFGGGRGITANLGTLLLSIWLIVTGLLLLVKVSFANEAIILAILAVAAGVLVLLREGRSSASIGWLLLSIWLIVQGAVVVLGESFNRNDPVLAVLGLAAGVFVLLRR